MSDLRPTDHAVPEGLLPLVSDPARVAVVQAVRGLDEHDDRLTDLARLASYICGTSMSAVTLIDDVRQQLRGRIGFDVAEMPVEEAFCVHALAKPAELLIVPDATRDPRFADNPLVLGPPHLRFYAGAPLVDANGYVLGTLCILDDQPHELDARGREALAALSRQAAALLDQRAAAHRDALTGLWDRGALDAWLALRTAEETVGLALVDLDQFTGHNIGLGPGAGDELLRAVAGRLLRASSDQDLVVRLGGDQFVVVTSWHGDDEEEIQRLRRIGRAAVDGPLHPGDRPTTLTASTGVVVAADERDATRLLHQATLAVREAKHRGGAQTVTYDTALAGDADRQWRLRQALDEAAPRGQLWLAYQPVVELASQTLVGVEALVRWNHPEYGAISPEELVELAESSGRMHELGRWVFDEALATLAEWRAAHPETDLRLHVNLSATQLDDAELVASLAEQLQRRGLPGDALTVELTEQAVMERPLTAGSRLHALRALDVHVALDDFGVGVSSLQRLGELPLDDVKIDKSFVDALDRHGRAAPLLDGIITLLHTLALTVVAEGVELETQARWLTDRGVQLAQGLFFGEPLSEGEIGRLLARQTGDP